MKRYSRFNKITTMRCRWLLLLVAGVGLWLHPIVVCGQTYNLRSVKGIEAFSGSAGAKELLGKNGFVVADPAFKQIFEAYIKAPQTEAPSETKPMGGSLPSYITPDSAWHTCHVLLEEGVKNMEEIQSKRLRDFSHQLLASATNSVNGTDDLILFASIGLALQDEPFGKLWHQRRNGSWTGYARVPHRWTCPSDLICCRPSFAPKVFTPNLRN